MKKSTIFYALLAIVFLLPLLAKAQYATVTTFAGGSCGYGGDGGPATAAHLSSINSICRDRVGNIYILDVNNARIRKVIASTGAIITVAGTGVPGFSGDGGPAVAAKINGGRANICCDDAGNIYLSDFMDSCLRKINESTGIITTISGLPGGASALTWHTYDPIYRIGCDSIGNVFIPDATSNRIYKVDTSGAVSTYCGGGTAFGDGPASSALLSIPQAVTVDRLGNIYFLENSGTRIRKVDVSGNLTTIAGRFDSTGAYDGDGGPASVASISTGYIYADSAGGVYLTQATYGMTAVRKIDATSGQINAVAGNHGISAGAIFTINDTGGIYYANNCKVDFVNLQYNGIRSMWRGDSLVSTPCTRPSTNRLGISGTVFGTPHSYDYAIVHVEYGDGATFDTSAPYWSTVISGTTVYGFGGNHWLRNHTYTYPGYYHPVIQTQTLANYYDVFTPPPVLVGSVCDTNVHDIWVYSFEDSVVTLPCTSAANVRFTIYGHYIGTPSIYDSVYFKFDRGDGVVEDYVISLDTTIRTSSTPPEYDFYYTFYHSYAPSSGIYRPQLISTILNTGSAGGHNYSGSSINNSLPFIIDYCGGSGGSLTSSIVPSDSTTIICSLPNSVIYYVTGTLHNDFDTTSAISYLVNYGDGTYDTTVTTPYTDGHGTYLCVGSVTHTYTMPGAYTPAVTPIAPSALITGVSPGTTMTFGSSCSALSGILYRDLNGNCTVDSGETRLAYWPIAIINNTLSDTTYYWCDTGGNYALSLIDGNSYTIMPDYFGAFGYGYYSLTLACPASGVYTLTPSSGTAYTQDFGFRCIGAPTSLDMNVSGWGYGFIPGDTGVVTIWASNPFGYICDSLTSTVSLTLDTLLTYIGMWGGPAPTSISGRTYSWVFSTTGDLLDFNAQVKVTCPTTATMGDTVRNLLHVTPSSLTDPDTSNNTYAWEQPVRTSWDPNEKDVSPRGFGTPGYIRDGTPLSYMVHFQNTGTARARNITVNDTISGYLDIATLQVIGSSASVIVVQPEGTGNVVKFRFNDIYLPDSGSDREGSKGYIAFNIVPHSGLTAGTQIHNTVGIFFDYNPAVVTNTTINTIEDTIGHVYGPDTVCVGASITLTNHISGGIWHSSNGHATVTGGVVTGVSAGRDTISYAAYGDLAATKIIWVRGASPSGVISGTPSLCSGSSVTLTTTGTGGSWSSASPSIATVAGGTVFGIVVGTAIISYSASLPCGTVSDTMTVSVVTVPAVTCSGPGAVCVGASITITPSMSGGAWASSTSSIATVSGGVVTGVTGGSVLISYTTSNMCGSTIDTLNIIVNPLPLVAISGPTSVCAGDTITLSPSVPGGMWGTSSSAIASIAAGVVTGVSAGADTIYYTASNACGSTTASATITVNPLPVAGTLSGSSSLCVGATTTLTSTVSGGTWTTGSSAIATVSGSVVTGLSPGVDTIFYTTTNACGLATGSYIVTVNALPSSGTLSGPSAVCAGASITLIPTVAGGSWSSGATTIASVSGGVVTGVSAGAAMITYTVTNSCGTADTMFSVTVNPMPSAGTLSGAASVCTGASITLTPTVAGGSWSSGAASIASVSGGVVMGVSAGAAMITYTVTNSCGTADTTFSVTVNPLPDAGAIYGVDSLCIGDTATMMNAATAGAWSSSNSAVATIASGGLVTGISTGTTSISYIATNTCGTASDNHSLVVRTIADCPTEVGTIKNSNGATVTIFPNPNEGIFTISIPAHENDVTINVTDIHGRTVKTITITDIKLLNIPVDLSHVAAGIYLIKAEVGDTIYYRKVVVIN